MRGDDHTATRQRHCSGGEVRRRHQWFGGNGVGLARALARGPGEPEIEMSIRTAQAMQTLSLNELVDIGLRVGPSFINDAAGAAVQNGMHSYIPFHSFLFWSVAGPRLPCYSCYPCDS